ncbi:MAG: hypothetical protein EPO24_04310 [Bacteroidetes bacterium]|nr:MAG: hypothetical protein EPO24_04310 [Bacteroidota bacterium]
MRKDVGMNGEKEFNKKYNAVDNNTSSVNIWDYIILILRWRKLLIINFLLLTSLAIIISFLLPKWYKSTASVLPPKDQGLLSAGGLASSVLKSIPGLPRFSSASQNLGTYNYLAILKSRTAAESVINKFNLIAAYGIEDKSLEKAISKLRDNTLFELQDDDNITIEVIDTDSKRAADIANYFVEILNTMSIQFATQEAKSNKEFIEKRLEENKNALRVSEEKLKEFQQQSNIFFSPDQSNSNLAQIAELYVSKVKKEIQIGILERSVMPDNENLRQLKIELSELDKRISPMPEAGIESMRLYREFYIQQKIFEYLTPVYEQAKIDEQKNVPAILILDNARQAETPFKPSKRLIVFIGAIVSMFISMVTIMIREYFSNLHNSPELLEKVQIVKRCFVKEE